MRTFDKAAFLEALHKLRSGMPATLSTVRRGELQYGLNITTTNWVRITFARTKRDKTLKERGLDFDGPAKCFRPYI